MKVYQAMGCTEDEIRRSIMYDLVNAWYCHLIDDRWGVDHWLSGALRNLDLLQRESGGTDAQR